MLSFEVLLVGPAPSSPSVREAFPDGLVDPIAVEGIEGALDRLDAEINCVVCDYSLPDGDGIELLSAIRERDGELPFVLYTDGGDESVAAAAIDADVTAYVPREPDSEVGELVDRVVELARRDHVAGTVEASDPTAANLRLTQLTMDEAPVGITVADPSEPDAPLVYVNDAFERLTGYDEHETLGRNCRFLQGEGTDPETVETIRQAIEDERPVSVEILNYRKSGEPFWNGLDVAPIRDDDGEVSHFVGFQTDITDRKEIQLRARRQAEELRADRRTRERLLARIDGLVRRVTAATVDSTARTELETRVCEAVVETNDYDVAWIGTRQMTSDRIVAGSRAGFGSATEISVPSGADDPVTEAVRDGAVAVAEADSLAPDSPHRRFVTPEGGVAAIPLRYRDAEYGVLVVYATRFRTLDDHETAVFDALGRVVGTGINALQNQRLLTTDEYLELVFAGGPPGPIPPLVELAVEADCEITYRGAVSRSDGRPVLSVVADGTDLDALRSAADAIDDSPGLTLVTAYDDGCLLEAVPGEASLVRTVLDHGGTVRSLVAAPDGAEIRIELPQAANPRAVVGAILERYDGLSLISQQRRERDRPSTRDLAETLGEELTDRQLEAVRKAYLSDYFEWPRPVSGEEIAESMGITRSTFHQHLRTAESKILSAVLEEFRPVVRSD
jgi:PAS domain S-box-containing protein